MFERASSVSAWAGKVMRFGSIFSGIGGFDLGFEQAGLSCSWQVEIDSDCGRVLSKQWPNVIRYKDVRDIGRLESVDVICGGFPCQDLSVAGKRAGLAGERSGLWFEFLRIIGLNRPRFIVIENVPGLLSSDEGRDFAVILRGLVECGYCLAWRIVDAQFYGVAQRRRRVFIVGSLGDGSSAQILFESESVSWNPPTRRGKGQGVADPITSAFAKHHGRTAGNNGDAVNMIAAPLTANYGKQLDNSERNGGPPNLIAEAVDVRNLRMQPDGTSGTLQHKKSGGYSLNYQNPVMAFRAWGQDGFTPSDEITPPIVSTDGGGANAPTIAFTERTRTEGRTFEAQEELAYAITNPGSGGRTHSRQVAGQFGVRRLTPRECERLQSFPDDFTRWDAQGKEISDSARYRMLGNAVCVNVARWIGKRMIEAEGMIS